MKSILMSIKPKYVSMILNGKKTIEVRKRFPKDYVGWVYIYCTKEDDLFKSYIRMGYFTTRSTADDIKYNGKGKVVARFWCDNVEEINYDHDEREEWYATKTLNDKELEKQSCLTYEELDDYLKGNGYAIHITKLEIFDKPREISEFRKYCDKHFGLFNRCLDCKAYTPDDDIEDYCAKGKLKLTKAPQSWLRIIEGE